MIEKTTVIRAVPSPNGVEPSKERGGKGRRTKYHGWGVVYNKVYSDGTGDFD